MKTILRRTVLVGLFAFLAFLMCPATSDAKTKTPTLEHKKVYLATYDIIDIKAYNASSKPKWSIANKNLAKITKMGGNIRVTAKGKTGTTKLTCKIGKKKLTCDLIIFKSTSTVKKSTVPYSVKQVSDNSCKVTINNKNSFPVYMLPGIEAMDSNWNLLGYNRDFFYVPAKTKVVRYVSFPYTGMKHISKYTGKANYCTQVRRMSGNVYTANTKKLSATNVTYKYGVIYATIKNKYDYPMTVRCEMLAYKDGKLCEVEYKTARLEAKGSKEVSMSFFQPAMNSNKNAKFKYSVRLTTMGETKTYGAY